MIPIERADVNASAPFVWWLWGVDPDIHQDDGHYQIATFVG
ncbi:hypothetical protein JCM19233_2395 [Vibrio astriarenae]|nr:hypothetical protein JCM19233_2395 [Vibrio sp. C7]